VRAFVDADAPRVCCPVRGVVVAAVPWARHDADHTYGFDQTVAWLATVCSKTAVTELMRIAWRSVGAVVARVWSDTAAGVDLLAGLRRIGIDEISYRKGHKYLLVIVDHDSGRLVWAGKGADQASLTERQREQLAWIAKTNPRCTGPGRSRKDCVRCSPSPDAARQKQWRRWTGGSAGHAAAGYPRVGMSTPGKSYRLGASSR
jgi:hypothetical protein